VVGVSSRAEAQVEVGGRGELRTVVDSLESNNSVDEGPPPPLDVMVEDGVAVECVVSSLVTVDQPSVSLLVANSCRGGGGEDELCSPLALEARSRSRFRPAWCVVLEVAWVVAWAILCSSTTELSFGFADLHVGG